MRETWVWSLVWEDSTCTEQINLCTTTPEPTHLEPTICNKGGNYNEKHVHRSKEWPLLAATRESPHVAKKTQHYQHLNYRGPRRREKERVWENFWRDYSDLSHPSDFEHMIHVGFDAVTGELIVSKLLILFHNTWNFFFSLVKIGFKEELPCPKMSDLISLVISRKMDFA